MTINERLSQLIKALGLNNNSFAKTLGVNPTVTFNIIDGRRTKPSYDLLEKIVFTFDNINIYWLLKGEGEMFQHNYNHRTVSGSPIHNEESLYLEQVSKEIHGLKKILEKQEKMIRDMHTEITQQNERNNK